MSIVYHKLEEAISNALKDKEFGVNSVLVTTDTLGNFTIENYDVDELEDKVADLESELEDKEIEIRDFEDEIEDLKDEIRNWKDKYKELENTNNELYETIEKQENLINELQSKKYVPQNNDSVISLESELKEYSQNLINTIYKWLDYKNTKWKKQYSERGLKSLLSEVKNQIKATSENVVICKIENSINNNWQGITWDSNKFLENDILELFEKTWNDLVTINTNDKELAKKKYLWLFRKISDLETAKQFARKIYAFYRKYVENLSEEKYCMTFANFLQRNIPEYQQQ